jgi:NADP-dependent 3-hydroxy acid dehydrogenase YdfG
VLGARRTDRLEKIVDEIRAKGDTAEFRALDVTKRKDVENFVQFRPSRDGDRRGLLRHQIRGEPAEAIAEAIAYAIGQPDGVDVNEIVVRPTVAH